MKILNDGILCKEKLTKKSDNIILPGKSKDDSSDYYTSELEVTQVGPECKSDIKVGDVPIISKWEEPIYIELTLGKSGDKIIMRDLIYKESSIIAVK